MRFSGFILGGFMRKLVIAVVAAVGMLLGLSGVAANAQVAPSAAGQSSAALCTPLGNIVGECAIVSGIGFNSDPQPDPCPKCAEAVAFALATVPAGHQADIAGDAANGVALLGQAAVAAKPDQAATLRAQAQTSFTAAGALVGKTALGLPGAGYVDPDTGKYVPVAKGWRVEIADHLTDGLNLLRLKPTQKDVTAAMSDFDAAYAQFVASSVPTDPSK
jgi:hypothetical protein